MKLIKLASLIIVASYSIGLAIALLAIYVGVKGYVQLLKAENKEIYELESQIAEIDNNVAEIKQEMKDTHFRYFMEVESL